MTSAPDPALPANPPGDPPRPLWSLLLALLVHGCAVVLLITLAASSSRQRNELNLETGAAFVASFSQLSLIAGWLFLGPGSRIWRIPLALVLAIAEPFLLGVYLNSHGNDWLAWYIIESLQFLGLAAPLAVVRSTGKRLKRAAGADAEPAGIQFQLWHLFAWTVGASGVLIAAQWLFRFAADVGDSQVALLIGFLAGSNALVALAAMWCVLARRPATPIRAVVLALTVIIVGLGYPEERPWDRYGQLPVLAAQAIIVLGTAAALRGAGFRLVSTRPTSGPSPSQELPSPHPLQSPDCGQN